MREKIKDIVFDSIDFLLKDSDKSIELNEGTPLYGINGFLSSLELIMLLSDIELSVSNRIGKDIVIADDKIMSQKSSPFATVSTLINFILEKL